MAARAAGEAGRRRAPDRADGAVGRPRAGGRRDIGGVPAEAWVEEQVEALLAMDNVRLRTRTMGAGVYDHGFVLAQERLTDHIPGAPGPRHRLWKIRAGQVVTATGAIERPLAFAGNDLPGVMLASAARDYLVNHAVAPGDRTVVVTNNDDAYRTAIALVEAG
jgi:sarcosine oxidase, subunit alpha